MAELYCLCNKQSWRTENCRFSLIQKRMILSTEIDFSPTYRFFLVSKTMASGIHSQHVMIGRCSVCLYHRLKFVLHFLFCMSRACTRHNKVRSHQRLEDFEKRYRTFYYLSLLNLDLVETWFRFLVFGLKLIFLWIDKSV